MGVPSIKGFKHILPGKLSFVRLQLSTILLLSVVINLKLIELVFLSGLTYVEQLFHIVKTRDVRLSCICACFLYGAFI